MGFWTGFFAGGCAMLGVLIWCAIATQEARIKHRSNRLRERIVDKGRDGADG